MKLGKAQKKARNIASKIDKKQEAKKQELAQITNMEDDRVYLITFDNGQSMYGSGKILKSLLINI